MRSSKPVLIVLGSFLALIALGLLMAGAALLWAWGTQRDADGFFTSPAYEVATDGYALTSEDVELFVDPGAEWFQVGDLRLRMTAEAAGDTDLFVAIGPSEEVANYLAGVPHDVVTEVGANADDVTYRGVAGTATPALPTAQDFWVETAGTASSPTVTWDVEGGDWTAVVMPTEPMAGFEATVSVGAETPFVLPIGLGLVVAGLLLGAAAAALLVAGTSAGSSDSSADSQLPAAAGQRPAAGMQPDVSGARPVGATSATPTVYPAALEGRLDAPSRWQWLVKWLLALPHVIVLGFLWLAFAVLTVVAFFAILFTGRYPRSIFDFNVGVMRWSWRVTYYAYGVLGTDRYPPFTLAPVAGYPAAFDVAYPQELSRGLVLVKWWLLAIPHYLIVGIFTGGLLTYTYDRAGVDGDAAVQSIGLIGLFALIAGVILLVKGRYPAGLYNLVMGLQRWVFRVAAYAALMTDEYPPFRLDTGGSEPSATSGTPPSAPEGGGSAERALIGS